MPRPRGGDWLEDEIINLKKNGVDILVSCLTVNEIKELDIQKEPDYCKKHGINFKNYSIEDREIPKDKSSFINFIKNINEEFQTGKKVVFHCRMGIGRASLFAVSIIILNGINPETAFEWVQDARGLKVPDTKEQKEWIFGNFKNNYTKE
jgi:protein-tyrosine phosphatase